MGAANGTQFRLVDADVELRRETRDFARWTLADVEALHRRFQKTFGFAITASQFESLLLLKAPESVGVDEVFEVLDANRDGRVDGLELLAALACVCRATFEDKARFAFDLFDFNHNGSLSLAELALLMKSVLIGMALLTGGGPESSALPSSQCAQGATSSMEAMMLCLGLAENAFAHVDKATSVLGFEDFIAWARSNREFMLQVERFRLIAEKAVGFEDALSLPDGSDDDSDLEVEDLGTSGKHQDAGVELQPGTDGKRTEIPPPWMIEPNSQPVSRVNASACTKNGMPPPANLQLEWVYGTNGPSARNACRLLATGEAVYFVGSYVVLYSSERHEQRYYRGHKRAIGCLDVNAGGEIVATGDACSASTTSNKAGAEIHVWNARTLHCLAVLRNFHPAGVAHVSFPAAASAATATLRQTQALSLGERSGAGGNSSAVLSSNLMKKKPKETEALLASIGSEDGASMALWNWQKEAVMASGRSHPAASGRRARTRGSGKRPLALALNEDGDEIVVVGAHFVVFHHVGGRFFKHKKPHWHGTVDPPLHTVPVVLSAVYYGIQTAVVGTARGELLLFERHSLTRRVQAHDPQTSVNVCLLSCQSMVLFSAGKDGQIKQWDSTLLPIGQSLDLHAVLPASASSHLKPESTLEGDDFRICSLDYDAQRKRFLVATRTGNIFEIDDEVAPSRSATSTGSSSNAFRWNIVASGHSGQPTRSIATASTVGGCFASCGVGERFVKLWSLRRRALVQHLRFPGATAAPSALEFSSDGERLAVGSEDGTVMLARRAGAASSGVMTIETAMKNTSSAVVAMRFGPLKTEPLLAVARDNGLVYLYRLELGGRRCSRYMLLKPQASDSPTGNASEIAPAHALDFSVDGAHLRTQHGNSMLYVWDLRQRAGTRVTSITTLRSVQWHTHRTSIGWDVGGLLRSSQGSECDDCVVGNTTRGLTLLLDGDGDINLAPFPCPPPTSAADDSSDHCWLSRKVPHAHLARQVSLFESPSSHPPVHGDFALRGSMVITSSQFDPAICQWRVEKELADVQPRSACRYDPALRKRLHALGLKDVYFDAGRADDEEEDTSTDSKTQRIVPRKAGADVSRAVVVRPPSDSSSQRSEAPDLALTLCYVFGFNHRAMSVNQSLACLGNGSYVYGSGPLLVVRHLHSFGTRQRIVASGLEHSVSCLVKHPSEPILAVGSRRDGRVVLLRTEKAPASSLSSDASFQQVGTLKASLISTNDKQTLIAVDFCDSNDSNSRNVQSDLAAVIWKKARSHVHTLVFYAWKRQLLLAHAPMTRMPVLFGKFAGSSDTGVYFVSGGVDHVTFWHLNPATGHVRAQQGVFGRHALVQTMMCAVHVAPFVVTGGEDGSVVLWESGVAAHSIQPSSTSRHSSGGDGVVALEHLQAPQVVLGALRNGSLVVWKYAVARSPTRESRAPGGRIQASTFLQLTRVMAVYDATTPALTSTLSPLFNNSPTLNYSPPSGETYVQGMSLLDDAAAAAVVLSNGEVLSVDLESIIEDSLTRNQTTSVTAEVGEKPRVLLSFSSEVNDVALHPRDLRWASASADGHVNVWNLHTNLLLQQQALPSAPRSLAWSASGEHLAVSLVNGTVAILNGATLDPLLQFTCGDTDAASTGQTRSIIFPKWCSIVKYSPYHSQVTANASRNWLALGCRDFNVYVYAWEHTGTEDSSPVYSLQHTFVGHTAPVEALDFSLDGEFLQSATSSNDRQLLRWALQKEATPKENSDPARDTAPGWALLDDAWASWTPTFAGPVEGLAECCGVGKTTSLARINSEDTTSKDSDGSPTVKKWSSPLPTMVVGLDDGHLMLSWYPLTRGDVTTSVFSAGSDRSSDPAVVTKEYMGCFSRGSLIRRVGFSFANAFLVALARNSSGSTQVAVWKTDFDDELRLRQRFAMKSAVSLEIGPRSYVSPIDQTLLDECIQAQQHKEPTLRTVQRRQEPEEDGDEAVETETSLGSRGSDEDAYLEFIYGLNSGATGSRNVFYADDAWEIVYAAGACGVVYNTKTQTQLLNYNAESGRHSVISALAVHPKGDLVASGECLVTAPCVSQAQQAPEIVIWDANSGSTVVRVATKHRPGVLLLEFSPDGHRLASIGMESDHTLAIYAISGGESEGGRLRATLLVTCKTSTRRVWGLSFGEDGELVTCGDQHILFWLQGATSTGRDGDDETRRPTGLKTGVLTSHKECDPQATLLQIAHMSGRARVVVSSQADGSLYVWKDRVCVIVRRDAHGDAPIPALAVDRKQSLLYSAGADSRICAWNAQLELVRVVADVAQLNMNSLGSLPLTSTAIQSLAVRDGHVLFTTAGSEVCELVEAGSSQQKSQGPADKHWRLHVYIRGHANGQLCGLAVHPSKRAQFASAGDDGVVRLWDAATRSLLAFHRWESASEIATGAAGSDELRALAFSADGKHLAVGTGDGVVRVLTAALDAVVTQWRCGHDRQQGYAVVSLQYSLDGKFLAVACQDGAAHVYSAASYRKSTMLRGSTHGADTVRLDFARDQPVLRAQCNGQCARFWELGTWRALAPEQVRDAHWASRRRPSLLSGTTQSEDFDGAARAVDGHATPVASWAVTKNELFLLSTGGNDRVVCQFRLPTSSGVIM
ncbi:Echinoderm microtubule-associated protein-like 1 [Phytophthora pseudosyringae]|uniref:Echinoderm microtubule-associated protein-like 1 n=1 Tax=Phytophthora pseudosyringae TaxID=221518 RepID=A0A8T1WI77_9STRA|nr:Echinoderm microtubule-associated protein-like 1 [Phytophthora pseudosyringae]